MTRRARGLRLPKELEEEIERERKLRGGLSFSASSKVRSISKAGVVGHQALRYTRCTTWEVANDDEGAGFEAAEGVGRGDRAREEVARGAFVFGGGDAAPARGDEDAPRAGALQISIHKTLFQGSGRFGAAKVLYRISSFEKKPAKIGIPEIASQPVSIVANVIGIYFFKLPIRRISCSWCIP